MNRIAGRAGIIFLICILFLAGMLLFVGEFLIKADDWVVFQGSPHFYYGCDRITDRDGVVLLQTDGQRTYASDAGVRMATLHWVGDRKGSIETQALSNYGAELAGFDILNGIYTYGGNSSTAQLTLSAEVQKTALSALGDYKGTIGVYNYKTGQLLCAVTSPTYDPENVPDIDGDTTGKYAGAYLNRFVQATYVPGSIFKVVTLAAALETIPDITQQSFLCDGVYEIAGSKITCEDVHGQQDLKTAFSNSCNCSFAQISQMLGKDTLEKYVDMFGVVDSINIEGITTSAGNFDLTDASAVSVAWGSIGQYTDAINPCRFMTFLGSIAADGRGVDPYLVERIVVDEEISYEASVSRADRLMSRKTAQILQEYMLNNVQAQYGAENFPGLTVCAKTGTAEVGGDKRPNAMFVGFVADEDYPLAFIATVEDSGYGGPVCIPIMSKVLVACKAAMDR